MPNDDPIDVQVLDEYRQMGIGNGPDFVTQLIDQYLAEATAQLAAIAGAVSQRDAPVLRAAAHTLKGSSSAVGANRLAAACEQLEMLARVPNFDGVPALVSALGAEFALVRVALAAQRADRRNGSAE